jgi:nicotinamidase/pyrazinamidase
MNDFKKYRYKKIIFWDVDTQQDFMKKDGKLYVPEAEEIIPNLDKLIRYARSKPIPIFGSQDCHSLSDAEILEEGFDYKNTFPPHCIKGTPGQEKIRETKALHPLYIGTKSIPQKELKKMITTHDGEIILQKHHFDVFTNPNTEVLLDIIKPEVIVVFGVALDVCDAHAIHGFLERGGIEVYLVTDAAKSINKEKGAQLINEWEKRGVRMVTTAEITEQAILFS